VRTVDCAPAVDTALGDVHGSIAVGVGNDSTRPADKRGLIGPVQLVPVTALRTRLRRVSGVYLDQRDTGPAGLVGQVSNSPSWAKLQQCNAARWGLRSRTLARIPVNSSTAIPREVRSASATMLFPSSGNPSRH
jgi:hypothetical protein